LVDNSTKRDEIHIGSVGGDAIGIGVSGSGNTIGKGITINQTTYNNLEPEYRNSLEAFLALINRYEEVLPHLDI
jgi:hypothetical protein